MRRSIYVGTRKILLKEITDFSLPTLLVSIRTTAFAFQVMSASINDEVRPIVLQSPFEFVLDLLVIPKRLPNGISNLLPFRYLNYRYQ